MKTNFIWLIFILLGIIIVSLAIGNSKYHYQEPFIPIINSSVRPVIRKTRLGWEGFTLPNYNRFLKQWGIY